MAKGKHAAALFEVIHAAKQKEQSRAKGGGFLTPSWWFKGKAATQPAPQPPAKPIAKPVAKAPPPGAKWPAPAARNTAPAPEPETSRDEETSHDEETSAFDAALASTTAAPAYTESESESPPSNEDTASMTAMISSENSSEATTPPPAHHDFVDNEEPALDDNNEPHVPILKPRPAPSATTTSSKSAPRSSARRPVDLGLDRGGQQISLRFSFTSAAISSFALIVVVVLAFIIGKSRGSGPTPAGAASIDQIKKGPAFSDVLKVPAAKNNGTSEPPIAVAPAPKPVAPVAPQNLSNGNKQTSSAQQAGQQATAAKSAPAQIGLSGSGKRIVGMQYVLIQSYPDPEDANDAAAALNKAGVSVTVEKGTRFAPTWSCVIGTRGFDHTRQNPEYNAYLKSIEDVSTTFAGASKFRRFEPRAVGWKD